MLLASQPINYYQHTTVVVAGHCISRALVAMDDSSLSSTPTASSCTTTTAKQEGSVMNEMMIAHDY